MHSPDTTADTQPIDWSPEAGFPPNAKRYATYPRRAYGSGKHIGLTILATANTANYYCSSTNAAGFKLLLHSPVEMPKIGHYGWAVAPGRETFVTVQPQISGASALTRDLRMAQRRCVFASESRLVYYRTYTRRNCEMECEARFIATLCECQLYYMPNVWLPAAGDDDGATETVVSSQQLDVCNHADLVCARDVLLAVATGQNASMRCDCLPACFEIDYDAHTTSTKLGGKRFEMRYALLGAMRQEFVANNVAVMHIFYTMNKFRGISIEPFIGFTEFLCNYNV